jgi:UDP-N-acetylglucosamine acyltransferase
MATRIHPTAIVDPRAELGDRVSVGAYAVIDSGVTIGDDCAIGPLCRFSGTTTIGTGNRFVGQAAVGGDPQDLKYGGEPTRLEIGNDNVIREFVTLNRGTAGGGGFSSIGDGNLFMAYAHVAHDCHVGSNTVFANAATLAGHVEVGDRATIGAFTSVHQFCRVGEHAFLGGYTVALKDCLPFMRTVGGRPAKCYGPNTIGLERSGFSEQSRAGLKKLWRYLYSSKLTTAEAVDKARLELADVEEVIRVLDFMAGTERGVTLARG